MDHPIGIKKSYHTRIVRLNKIIKRGSMAKKNEIIRIWKGWTNKENAPVYEKLLENEIFPEVKKKGVSGLKKVSISTRELKDEVEFLLVLQFDSLESVKTFAGENYKTAYIPDKAKRILSKYETTARHYEFKKELIL